MAAAGMKLTWSPASNVALYGTTTDIPAALAAGVVVSIGPDWSMGGSQNLLDELRFARQWSDDNWAGLLTNKRLVEMVTTNAAAVLGLANTIGRLEAGYLADVIVVQGDTANPYAAIVNATPSDISLVMVGGVALYGDASSEYELLAPQSPGCEQQDICGTSKFICVAENDERDGLGQTLAEIRAVLEDALVDLDNIPTSSGCSPVCAADEQCFQRTVYPTVDPGFCGGSCPPMRRASGPH